MKVRRHLSRLEPLVLNPLHGVPEDDWHRAPRGKWTVSQVVEHLAVSVDLVAQLLEERGELHGRRRRSKPHQTVLRHLVLGTGRLPRGFKTVESAAPCDRPEPELVTAQFRMGVEMTRLLDNQWSRDRKEAVFVRHPYLGDLNLPEWVRFHYIHCRHHSRQIGQLLEWMGVGGRENKEGAAGNG
jgi:hypothetical protein